VEVCLITDRPQHPVLTAVATRLSARHRVRIVDSRDPTTANLALEGELRQPADVYLLRSHAPGTVAMSQHLEKEGAVVVNCWNATAICIDRVELSARAQAAGLPWPETCSIPGREASSLGVSSTDARAARAPRYPVVVKSRWSRRGDLVQKVDSLGQFMQVWEAWPDEPLVIQSYVPNEGADRKLYVVDDQVFGLLCPSRLSAGDPEDRVPIGVPEKWRALALQVGRALNLRAYGVDLVLSPEGPVIVDVNPFPGFRGVPGAAEALVAMVDRLAAEVGATG
jgi:ribosomal protein S6--L-glutamate ligase